MLRPKARLEGVHIFGSKRMPPSLISSRAISSMGGKAGCSTMSAHRRVGSREKDGVTGASTSWEMLSGGISYSALPAAMAEARWTCGAAGGGD